MIIYVIMLEMAKKVLLFWSPDYVQIGVNAVHHSGEEEPKLKLCDVSDQKLLQIVDRVNQIYETEIRVEAEFQVHPIVEEEMSRNSSFFGPEVLKHLVQNSSLLGSLNSKGILNVRT